MSTTPIVRKKRNFKALQLDVTKSAQSPPPQPPLNAEPVATRPPPQANGKRRPPPMKLAAPKVNANPTRAEDNLLTVNGGGSNSAPATGALSATRPYHNDLTQKLANLDMNAETKYDLRDEDLKELQELGQGNGGSVKKVQHIPTGKIMAKKVSKPPDIPLSLVRHFHHLSLRSIHACVEVSSSTAFTKLDLSIPGRIGYGVSCCPLLT